ncbi:hypothetical protein GGR51DRAFT_524706 [Nemania sp. FL0031]|nr:hypothetical protein GGR51DRAFT_524706 [Nemania sp. FL0031]
MEHESERANIGVVPGDSGHVLAIRDSNNNRPTSRFPTEEEWGARRDRITQLYLHQGLKLKEVMTIMAEEGFIANKSMYNLRITRWGINKNYKAKEKDAVLEQLAMQPDAVMEPAPVTIHGRAVRMDRIERYSRKRQREDSASQDSRRVQEQNINLSSESTLSLYVNGSFNLAPSTRKEEYLLLLTRDFANEVLLSLASRSGRLFRRRRSTQLELAEQQTAQNFSHLTVAAAQDFSYGKIVEGTKRLDQACDSVKAVLRNEPLQLLLRVWYIAIQDWKVDDVRKYFIGFLGRMAVAVLGARHTLARMLDLMTDSQTLNNALVSVMELMVDVNRTSIVMNNVNSEGAEIRGLRGAIDTLALRTLRRSNNYATADRIARILVANYGPHFGLESQELREVKVQLATIYTYQKKFEAAAPILQSVLQNPDGSRNWDHDYKNCRAAWELGMVYGRLGRYADCAEALEFALQIFDSMGFDPTDRDTVLVLLDTALCRLRASEELERVRYRYGMVTDAVILERAGQRMRYFEWPGEEQGFGGGQ